MPLFISKDGQIDWKVYHQSLLLKPKSFLSSNPMLSWIISVQFMTQPITNCHFVQPVSVHSKNTGSHGPRLEGATSTRTHTESEAVTKTTITIGRPLNYHQKPIIQNFWVCKLHSQQSNPIFFNTRSCFQIPHSTKEAQHNGNPP